MKNLFESIKKDLTAGIAAVNSFADKNGGFYGGFEQKLNSRSSKIDALSLVLAWTKHMQDIAVSIEQNAIGSAAYESADAAESAVLAAGGSKAAAIVAWNQALADGKAKPADTTDSDALAVLAVEIAAEIERVKIESATKILRICRVCGDRALIDRDPSDPAWAANVHCVCLNCPDDGKGWAHS